MRGGAFTRHVGSLTLGAMLGLALRAAVRTFRQDIEIAALRSQVQQASRAGEIVARATGRAVDPEPVARPSFRLIPGGPDAEVPPDLPPAKNLLSEFSLFHDAFLGLANSPRRRVRSPEQWRALIAEATERARSEESPLRNVVPLLRGPEVTVILRWPPT